jgi:hypothetical protein
MLKMEKNYKIKISPILQTSFLLIFVLAGFFGFGSLVKIQATGINVLVSSEVGVNIFGETPKIYISVADDDVHKLPSQVEIKTFVNQKQVGDFKTAGADLRKPSNYSENPGTYQAVQITNGNGFVENDNNISVVLIDATQMLGSVVGTGSANFLAIPIQNQLTNAPKIVVSPDKTNYSVGDEIVITVENLPSGGSATMYLNGNSVGDINGSNRSFSAKINPSAQLEQNQTTVEIKADVKSSSGEILTQLTKSLSVGGQSGAGIQITINSNTYATGAKVSVTSSNLPTDGSVSLFVNGVLYQQEITTAEMTGYAITVDSHFTSGSNMITAEVFNSESKQIGGDINVGTITVSSTAGTLDNGKPCDNDSQCKSNFCNDQNGLDQCAACSDPSDCNTAGSSAYTCTAGVCVSAATTPPAGGQTANSITTLYNPIRGYNSLTDLLVNIMKGFLGILAVWAVAFIVIGGFRMVVSSGSEEAVLAAKKTITWAVLGLLVAVLSFAIIAIVQNLIGVNVAKKPTSAITTINKNV